MYTKYGYITITCTLNNCQNVSTVHGRTCTYMTKCTRLLSENKKLKKGVEKAKGWQGQGWAGTANLTIWGGQGYGRARPPF